jgi:transcriptional regulator with XRE-family HTH domain
MQKKGLTKVEMARRMRTSRAALDRLLDPENEAVTLGTLQKAAAAVGRQVRLELIQLFGRKGRASPRLRPRIFLRQPEQFILNRREQPRDSSGSQTALFTLCYLGLMCHDSIV